MFWCKNQNIDSIQQILEEEESSLVEVLVELSPGFKLNNIDYVMRYSTVFPRVNLTRIMLTKGL